jgi:hypothetical protein
LAGFQPVWRASAARWALGELTPVDPGGEFVGVLVEYALELGIIVGEAPWL